MQNTVKHQLAIDSWYGGCTNGGLFFLTLAQLDRATLNCKLIYNTNY